MFFLLVEQEDEMSVVFGAADGKVLEISSRSPSSFGKALSAMNLMLPTPWGAEASVEALYQGSKVFANGGPYAYLYRKSGFEAKRDRRLRRSGRLVAFDLFGMRFPLEPETGFYDMLWITAYLRAYSPERLLEYDGFTDCFYRPGSSRACQARSALLLMQRQDEFACCSKALEVAHVLGLRRS